MLLLSLEISVESQESFAEIPKIASCVVYPQAIAKCARFVRRLSPGLVVIRALPYLHHKVKYVGDDEVLR